MAIQGFQRFCESHPQVVVAIALGVGAGAAVLLQESFGAQKYFQDLGMQECIAAVKLPARTALLEERMAAVQAVVRCALKYLAQ